jgi:hypothetical protein
MAYFQISRLLLLLFLFVAVAVVFAVDCCVEGQYGDCQLGWCGFSLRQPGRHSNGFLHGRPSAVLLLLLLLLLLLSLLLFVVVGVVVVADLLKFDSIPPLSLMETEAAQ